MMLSREGGKTVIKLWEYIRKSHLTHMYGASDNMRAVNVNDQKMKFNNMRQGDREYVSDFKTRYDNQLKANEGVGIVADDESLVAIDFLSKLDPKRFTSMLTVLRNNAAINISSYPITLAGAYRTASTWTSGPLLGIGSLNAAGIAAGGGGYRCPFLSLR
jgi:hypothetical protein